MAGEEALNIDVRNLQLRRAWIQNGELDDLQYDPHLQEERLRKKAGQPGSIAITFEDEVGNERTGKRWVDIIAKLREPDFPVPPEITYLNRIGERIVTGTIEVDQIPGVRKQVASLKAATEIYLHLYNSLPAVSCDSESLGPARFLGLNGKGVVVGVVDFGCDVRHGNFRDSKGKTRLHCLWDQTQDSPEEQQPKEYGYGREFTAEMINKALKVSDDKVYETLGYTPTIAAHGTHVMDVAAGNGSEMNLFGGKVGVNSDQKSHPGVAPEAQLVFVHLRTFNEGLLGNSSYLLDAVDYIFKKAEKLGMPAVVNLSLSTTGGPHDGSTLVEEGFAALVNARPGRAIVISAGNSYLQEGHISGTVREGESRAILWRTDPRYTDPRSTKNEMEVWYRGDRDLQVTLTAPNGKVLGTVDPGETYEIYSGDVRVGRISNRVQDPNNGDNQIDIRLPHLANAPWPWKIELSSMKGDVDFHAWIEQDDHGLSRFEGPIDPQYTIGAISCSDATLTVGAFDTSEMACLALPFEASSAGPTRQGKQKPDLSAPGVGIVAARAHKGTTVMSGTSMAAAHVTGLVALLFDLALRSGRGPLKYADLRAFLLDTARKDPDSKGWDARRGQGKIDGVRSMESLLTPAPGPIEIEPEMVSDFLASLASLTGQPVPESLDEDENGQGDSGKTDALIKFAQEKIKNGKGFNILLN